MPADVLAFTDAVVSLLASAFASAGSAAEVTREYEVQYDLGKVSGVKVNVFPCAYARDEANRAEDYLDLECTVVTLERYTEPGRPTRDWLDERVDLVEQCVFETLRQATRDSAIAGHWLHAIEVTTVYDLKMLRQQKVFWSEVEACFRKLKR